MKKFLILEVFRLLLWNKFWPYPSETKAKHICQIRLETMYFTSQSYWQQSAQLSSYTHTNVAFSRSKPETQAHVIKLSLNCFNFFSW